MNKEQMTQEQRKQLIEKLRTEYNDWSGKIARLNAFLCDIDFVEKVPDIAEQELMEGQLRAMKACLVNLRGRIMFQEARLKKDEELDNWMNTKRRVVNTLCGPVQLLNLDEQHHCGQDACCQVGDGSAADEKPHVPESLKELVGMQIVSVFPPGWKCQGCAYDSDYFRCEKKVELVGGYYICLAPLPNSIVTE